MNGDQPHPFASVWSANLRRMGLRRFSRLVSTSILALSLPSGSALFAPEPRRLWTSGPATRVRGRQPFLDQNVTNVPAVGFKRAAGAAEIAKPLAQRGCGARTYNRRVVQPAGQD